MFGDESANASGGADFVVVDFEDNIAVAESSAGCGAVWHDGATAAIAVNEGAASDCLAVAQEVVAAGDVWGDRDVLDADEGALDAVMLKNAGEHAFDGADRDGKTDVLGFGGDGGVDAYYLACCVDEGATGVAGVDGGVGLDEVSEMFDVAAVATGGGDATAGSGDNASCDGVLVLAEGVADGDNCLADGDCARVAECGGGKIGAGGIDFEEGDVVERVVADDFDVVVGVTVISDD